MRAPLAVWTLAAGICAAGCATEKSSGEWAVPEVVIETVPKSARVTEAGSERGTTPYVLKSPSRQDQFVLTVGAEGYHPQELRLTGEEVASRQGEHLLLALRPATWDAAGKQIQANDGATMARAGFELAKTGRCPDALQFFNKALQVSPRTAVAYKGIGNCYSKMKKRKEALSALKQYLLLAPDAPDAVQVQEAVSRAQGDIDLVPARE